MRIRLPSNNTSSKIVKKTPLPLLIALGAVAPVGLGIGLLANEIKTNPNGVKSTLKSIKGEIKEVTSNVSSTLGKVVNKSGDILNAGFNKIMFPAMVVGSLVVVMMILKK